LPHCSRFWLLPPQARFAPRRYEVDVGVAYYEGVFYLGVRGNYGAAALDPVAAVDPVR
jgi:hypothetical protein